MSSATDAEHPVRWRVPMPIVCLRVPYFALRIAVLDRPELDGHPLLLSNPQSGRAVVIDATPEAHETGIRPGMTLREATALCPGAITLMPDPVREAATAQDIRERLEQLSPLVEPDDGEAGCWYIDLAGLERHYGTVDLAAQRMIASSDQILRARAGIAPGKFCARVAAGVATAGTVRTVEAGAVAAFLAEAPVSWLPLPPDTIHQLERLGIPTLGALARLPGGKVAARFGPAGHRAWNLARGLDDRPVIAPPRIQSVVEELVMPAPMVSREMLIVGIRQLVTRAFGKPALRNRQVRQVALRATIEGARRSWERTLVLKEPCGPDRLISAIDLRLHTIELPGPIESLTLEFSGIVNETARQQAFPMMGTRATAPLTAAIHHLKQRYGLSPLYHVVEVEPWSRIPERRHALITYDP
ncbi:MAG: DNA polymerase Y family protein [Chloroflexia bacterium]|nr:DNA polymerase Y family protein [Chloroflexia bacterium]